jgi:hypothetical protein
MLVVEVFLLHGLQFFKKLQHLLDELGIVEDIGNFVAERLG